MIVTRKVCHRKREYFSKKKWRLSVWNVWLSKCGKMVKFGTSRIETWCEAHLARGYRERKRSTYVKTVSTGGAGRPFRNRCVRTFRGHMLAWSLFALVMTRIMRSEGGMMHRSGTCTRADTARANVDVTTHRAWTDRKRVFAYTATPSSKSSVHFDTDSYPIKIDNCCTSSMTFFIDDFVPGSMVPVKRRSAYMGMVDQGHPSPTRVRSDGRLQTTRGHQGTLLFLTPTMFLRRRLGSCPLNISPSNKRT
jgi:hypothetical protein